MTPGQDFARWLESETIRNEGYQNNVVIAKRVDQLIEEARKPLILLISQLILENGCSDSLLFIQAQKTVREATQHG